MRLDPELSSDALGNLVQNAVKYTDELRSLCVTCSRVGPPLADARADG
jgi:hypothetical protein